ncbi:transcriptional regulator [Haliea sp.]|uniref:helix-turn-helix transcriptional regulator n=1 Tax=Haliea sp. TaxID=1932666 RepID=UPI003528ABA5
MKMSARDLFYSEGQKFDAAEERAFARDELIYNVTEDILIALEDFQISKRDLAERLGKSRAYVSQLLSGARNMTFGTFSDICFVIGVKPVVGLQYCSVDRMDRRSLNNATWTNIDVDKNAQCAKKVAIYRSTNVIDCTGRGVWESSAA